MESKNMVQDSNLILIKNENLSISQKVEVILDYYKFAKENSVSEDENTTLSLDSANTLAMYILHLQEVKNNGKL